MLFPNPLFDFGGFLFLIIMPNIGNVISLLYSELINHGVMIMFNLRKRLFISIIFFSS